MKVFDSYRLLITPLSPIHIGTGDSYEPTNYVIEDDLLHEFDTGSVVTAMTAADRKLLLEIASRQPSSKMIQAIQRFFFERRGALMAYGVNYIPVLPGVADLYRSRIGQTANREANGHQVLNRLEIDRTAYNPITRQPILFGSSLKGAIRTALLDGLNQGALRRGDKKNKALQQRLFQYRAGQFELDPLRLVQLADGIWQGEANLPTAQVYLAVNRKKAPVEDEQGRLRPSQAECKNLYQILESVPSWHYRAFSSQMNLQCVAGIDKEQHRLPASALRFNMQQIAQACNRFYCPVFEVERHKMRERRYLDPNWDRAIGALLDQAQTRMDRGEVFLLRVGRHSGAESVTLKGVRNIKIMGGKGQKPEYSSATKTFWLAANDKDQQQNLLPFGWLLVEVQPLDSISEDWLALKSACEPYLIEARALAAKFAKKQKTFEQIRAQVEAKRREEAMQAQQHAEEQARLAQAEAERKAQLAAMSEEERAVADLKSLFEDEAHRATLKAGGATVNRLNELLAQATDWPVKIAHHLADLAEEIYRHPAVGWGPGKKKRARQDKIEALRGKV